MNEWRKALCGSYRFILRPIYNFYIGVISLRHMATIVNANSYFPSLPRKSKFVRYMDNLVWLFRSGELNGFYNYYALDIKGRQSTDYRPYRDFSLQRDCFNNFFLTLSDEIYNYISILRDKIAFQSFFELKLCL